LHLLLNLASTVILGPESRGTHTQILLSQIEDSLNSRGPVPHIYISQKEDGPVIPPGSGFPFRRLLRLAVLQWRYLTLPPHGPLNCSELSFLLHSVSVSTEICCVKIWFPRIHLHGNVFVNSIPSNGSTCHNIYRHLI
jgi:hypothetical protein